MADPKKFPSYESLIGREETVAPEDMVSQQLLDRLRQLNSKAATTEEPEPAADA